MKSTTARYTTLHTTRRTFTALPALALSLALGGCADSLPSLPKLSDLNPFAEKPVILPGKRIAVNSESRIGGDLAAADRPIVVPVAAANESWAQPGGASSNAPGHLNLNSSIKTSWTADVGQGSSKYGKLTASPIIYDGKVFTLDAAGKVSAFALSGGSAAWRVSIVPEGEKNPQKGYGGGLAADQGRLYIASGYGTVVALDPKTGKKLWDRNIGVPMRSSPTAANDRVYVTTTDGEVYSLSGADGTENWKYKGVPEKASFIHNASPAVEGDIVLVPFSSGDVVALNSQTGQTLWTENLARTRTASSLAAMSDAARPVITGGTAFAIGHAGRMVATNAKSGERLWSLSLPGIQQPWVAGDSVFVVDTTGQLHAVTRRDGKIQWTAKLPGQGQWSGPVLAGGKLWLTSSKGALVGVEAVTGKVASTAELGTPVFIAPVVAAGRMFVLADTGKLIALN